MSNIQHSAAVIASDQRERSNLRLLRRYAPRLPARQARNDKSSKLAIGLMSGTSGDGVSLALGSFNSTDFELLAYQTFPFPADIQKKILQGPTLKTPEISRLNMSLGHFFAGSTLKFLRKNKINPSKVSVIGSHGQTIYHGPYENPSNTFQIGEPSIIAEQTGIPVAADFRVRDIAAGGQGAPLIPFFDHHFFGGKKVTALQNIGGIANVTVVGKSVRPLAFDNGPGNCLVDLWIQKQTKGRMKFDVGGKIAKRGTVDLNVVRIMGSHPYFKIKPPKSTGREVFNERFIPPSLKKQSLEDCLATLTYFTAHTIHESYRKFISKPVSEIIVSGGGALNLTLMDHLKKFFTGTSVRTIADYGIPVQAKEPLAFAFFGLRAIEGKINHLPEGTGAKRATILGKIIPSCTIPSPLKGRGPG